jgi:uncharacterized protein YdaU (DUF1376 family)
MAEFPALPLWTDAFIGDTTHLDARETGAYLMLIMTAWRSPDGALPDDDRMLARMARCTPQEWRFVGPVVRQFWQKSGGQLRNSRLEKERSYLRSRSHKSRIAARAKWLKNKETGYADAYPEHMPEGMPDACQTDAPTPTPTPKTLFDRSESFIESERAPEKSGARPARGTRLAKDWNPGHELEAFATRLGLDAKSIAETFRDYWTAQPGAKGVKADWPATWRNWCRRQSSMEGNRAGKTNGFNGHGAAKPKSKIRSAVDELEDAIRERREAAAGRAGGGWPDNMDQAGDSADDYGTQRLGDYD